MAKKKSKAKTKKQPASSPKSKTVFPFYSEDRWKNWIEQVKESGFELNEDGVVLNSMKTKIRATLARYLSIWKMT